MLLCLQRPHNFYVQEYTLGNINVDFKYKIKVIIFSPHHLGLTFVNSMTIKVNY